MPHPPHVSVDDVARALRERLDALTPSEATRQRDLAAVRQRRQTTWLPAWTLIGAASAAAAFVVLPMVSSSSPSSPPPSTLSASASPPSPAVAKVDEHGDIYIAVDDGVEALVISIAGG